jgi:GNAT superfamily N-acetyltransferase
VTVRPIAEGEIDELSRMSVDVYTSLVPGLLPDDYVAELADVAGRADEALVLVAVDERGRVLGGIAYVDRPGRWGSMENLDEVELRMLVVDPHAQGRGVGTALVQGCVERARLDGKRRITLHTTSFMPIAQRLYERAGFRRRPEGDLLVEGDILLLGYVLDLDG